MMFCCASSKCRYDSVIAGGGRVGVNHLGSNGDLAARGDLIARRMNLCQHRIATGFVGVPDINLQPSTHRNTVDGSGEDIADTGGAHSVNCTAVFGGGFHGQGDLSGGAKGVSAAGHKHGACMSAFAFHPYTQTCRGGDGGDNTQSSAMLFQ